MEVKYIRTTSARVDDLPITNGQLIYLEDISQAYYDLDNARHELTGGSSQLAALTDVDLTQLSSGQVLKYNATSEKWENFTDNRELTQAQYNALSQSEKMNGTTYFITDGVSPGGTSQSSNRNLLDNPWFTVNQRGASSYNGSVYTVDRWRRNADNSSGHTLTVGGVTLSLLKGDFFQSISTDVLTFKSIPYTVSAIIDGKLYSRTFTPYGDGNNHYLGGAIGLDNMTWNIIEHWGANVNLVGINNNSATTDHTVTAIKLEPGTQSTLSHDTAPNYAQELLKCQRYYFKTKLKSGTQYQTSYIARAGDANYIYGVQFPVEMRTEPTISNIIAKDFFQVESAIDSGITAGATQQGIAYFEKQSGFNATYNYYMQFEASAEL